VKFSLCNQIFTREADEEYACQFGSVWGSVDAGTHRAATGRERRADVKLCDYTSAELLQQRSGRFNLARRSLPVAALWVPPPSSPCYQLLKTLNFVHRFFQLPVKQGD
jgi:hypothetical protein